MKIGKPTEWVVSYIPCSWKLEQTCVVSNQNFRFSFLKGMPGIRREGGGGCESVQGSNGATIGLGNGKDDDGFRGKKHIELLAATE